jgi:hypothetical protein
MEAKPTHNGRDCFSNRGLEYFKNCWGLLDEGDILAIAQEFAEWLEPEGDHIEIFRMGASQ